MKQLLHEFLSHSWVHCKDESADGDGADPDARRPRRAALEPPAMRMRKTGDQLEAEPLPLSKIHDGSRERNGRPRATAVFDF